MESLLSGRNRVLSVIARGRTNRAKLRKSLWLLKKSVIGTSVWLRLSLLPSFFFSPLSGSFHSGGRWLAEEPHQSLEVLGRRCEEELLPNELYPA
jgi:hypothetical protein